MDIDGLFQSPSGRLAEYSEIQSHLYRHNASLHDYFEAIQLDSIVSPRATSDEQRPVSRFETRAVRAVDSLSRIGTHRKIKTDVLICPNQDFSRKSETSFFLRTVLGVAKTDAKILCILPDGAPCRGALDAELEAAGRTGQVQFIDPAAPSSRIDARLFPRMARMRGRSAFAEVIQILEPYGLSLGKDVKWGFEQRAYSIEAWERLASWIEFDIAILRCHWFALGSSISRTAIQRGKPVITFQQGVIGHTLDVPVTATKYVAFGQPSASFLAQANSRFFQSVGVPVPKVEFVNGGCLFDKLIDLPNQFDLQTLLMVDVPTAQMEFYGVERQCDALLQLAERLLTANPPLRRLIIRPHPFWRNLEFGACQRLVREHSTRCELSHPVWPLEDDLRRSSAVVGIFSGVLTVSSACGLPTVFLETDQGYKTGDLACFAPQQTLLPGSAFDEIRRILSDRRAYEAAHAQALLNGREYYANGRNLDLDSAFVERLLRAKPMTNRLKRSERKTTRSQEVLK